jgi:hypothetical protein
MNQQPLDTVVLLGLAIGSDAILMQEAHGQAALCKSGANAELPRDVSASDRAILIGMGVIFGETVKDDDLFVNATLPAGWSIKRTDHHMWSKLVDANGAERAAIFYKAAFYDRRADMHVSERYVIEAEYPCPAVGKPRSVTLTDAETSEVLFTGSEIVPDPDYNSNPRALAVEWLKQNRPGFNINRGWTL